MKHSLETKIALVTPPGALVDNASLTTEAVDCKGWSQCSFYVVLGATDVAMAALKLQQSDASGSGFADISGADFSSGTLPDGTSAALPSATDDNKVFAVHVDLRGKKRYLDLVATGGDGTSGAYIMVFAILSRPAISPSTTADRGLSQELMV